MYFITKRRLHRMRQKVKSHKVRKSLRKNVSRFFVSRNRDEETREALHPRQRSPESVLFKTEHANTLCGNRLSPDILKQSSPRSSVDLKNDLEIDDGLAARMIKQSSPISSQDRESKLPMYDFKHGTKCIKKFPNLEDFEERELDTTKSIVDDSFYLTENSFDLSFLSNEPNNANGTVDGGSSLPNIIDEVAYRNILRSPISRRNLEFQSCDDMCPDSRILELTIASDIQLSDRDRRSDFSQKIEYHWDDTRNYQELQNITTHYDFCSHESRRGNTIITWMIAICSWLIKKLLRLINISYKKLHKLIVLLLSRTWTKKFNCLMETMQKQVKKKEMLYILTEKFTRLSEEVVQIRTNTEATLSALTADTNVFREKMREDNMALLQELKKLHETLEEIRLKSSQPVPLPSTCPSSAVPPPPPPPPPPLPPMPLSFPPKAHTSKSAPSIPPPFLSLVSFQSAPLMQPTSPNSSRSNKNTTLSRKCSSSLFNRPSITVEDLLKVTLKKTPRSTKENIVPGPKGPVVSLEMLRNVKLKSAKRRANDQIRSPRNGRVVKNRIASNVNLSPILSGAEGNLERILRRVDLNRPRRLFSDSNNFRERDFTKKT